MTDELNGMIPEDENNIVRLIDDEDNTVELTDEDGETVQFEHLASVLHEGKEYVVLLPLDEESADSDDGEVLILEIGQDENGEDIYVSVEDDNIAQAVFDKFIAAMDDSEE